VVESCAGIPVVIAGGPKIEPLKALINAHEAILGGAAGVSFGRNVINRKDTTKFLQALRLIVHENVTAEVALHSYDISE
jgi:DhnA family fructose-bisphosphate aldolase class Ia